MGDIDMSAIRDAEYLGPWSSNTVKNGSYPGGNWYQFLYWWYGHDKYLEMLESDTLPPEPVDNVRSQNDMTYDTLDAANRLVSRLKALNGMRSTMLEFNITSNDLYRFNGDPVEVQIGNRSLPLDAELFNIIYEYVMKNIKQTENAFHDM